MTRRILQKLINSLNLQQNRFLLQLLSAKLYYPYSQQPTKSNQMQKEPDLFYAKYSMKLDSHQIFIVKFTTLNLSTNISTVLPIVSAQEDYLCTCRFGTTGPAGANVIQVHQQRHLFHWSWIIYMPQII